LLVLNNDAEQGAAVLREVKVEDGERAAALSGAMARTVEFFVGEKEFDAAERGWWKWQRRYPLDFLDGYSVLLRARLMREPAPAAAATVAEAFATAVPASPYAPALLKLASDALKPIDAKRSGKIFKQLKERYPEDPLSQE